jgi:two-component system response regulator YesN
MYRLLTADDEPDKLEALRNLYDWAGCRVEICGEAGDGVDAYEQIVAKKPDICIMDIRMPLLSGLEVIERARKAGSVTKYIILSGYDEFDYAKEAIGLSVVDYLLKPCRCENIVQSVQKCIRLIEQEKKQRKLQEDYRHLLKNSLGNERERLLCDLILGNPVENLESRKRECCLSALGNTVAVCVFDASGGNSAQDRLPELRGETETALTAVRSAVVLNFRDQVVAVVGMDGITDGFEAFRGGLKNAADRCYRLCGISCAAGVSECKQGFEFLHSAYLEAKQAVETLKFLFGRNILFFAELNGPGAPPLPENPEQPFLRNLADAAATEKLADRFLAACNTCSMDVKERTKESVVTLICNLYQSCREEGLSFRDMAEQKRDAVQQVMASGSIGKIRSALVGFLSDIAKNMEESNSTSALVRRTVAYIQQNYQNRITLESAAEEIHVTPSYLCMLFKQQTGLNFIEYVNRFRVRQAERLLQGSSLKSYEIAFEVGFQDEKYFHNLFKRYTGVTTRQFRDGVCGCGAPPDPALQPESRKRAESVAARFDRSGPVS